MSKDTGGPAFPVTHYDIKGRPLMAGMTLLDWFAGQALTQMTNSDRFKWDFVAKQAYDVAEAMLAEKRKREIVE